MGSLLTVFHFTHVTASLSVPGSFPALMGSLICVARLHDNMV